MMMLRSAVKSFCSSGRDFEVDAESLFRKMVAAVSHRTFLRVQNLCHRSPFFSDTLICLVTRCKRAEVSFLAIAMKQAAGPIPTYNPVSASKAFSYTACPMIAFGGLYTGKWLYSKYEDVIRDSDTFMVILEQNQNFLQHGLRLIRGVAVDEYIEFRRLIMGLQEQVNALKTP